MKRKAAIVHWLDAYTNKGTYSRTRPGLVQISVGVIVADRKDCLKLAQTADASGFAEPFRDILTIPRGMIQTIDYIQIPGRQPK